jgi:Ca2+-binding RTX toxin-like protein
VCKRPPPCGFGDTIRGTEGPDRFDASEGGRKYAGLGGDDVISGSSLADCLSGGPGEDRIDGGAGDDRIVGDAGSDTLHGSGGHDVLDGKAGEDSVEGGDGPDVLTGGAGRDALAGGAGRDILSDGQGRNAYSAGAGDDEVYARQSIGEAVECGPGKDYAFVDRKDKVTGCEHVDRPGPAPPAAHRKPLVAAVRPIPLPRVTWWSPASRPPYWFGLMDWRCAQDSGRWGFGYINVNPIMYVAAGKGESRYVKIEYRLQVLDAANDWSSLLQDNEDYVSHRQAQARPWWHHRRRLSFANPGESYRAEVKLSWFHDKFGSDHDWNTNWMPYVYCPSGGE